MRRTTLTRQRLAALFFAALLLLFSPVVMLFDRPVAPFGTPLLYLYLFGVWALIIGLSAWILSLDGE